MASAHPNSVPEVIPVQPAIANTSEQDGKHEHDQQHEQKQDDQKLQDQQHAAPHAGCSWFCLRGCCDKKERNAKWLLFWMCCAGAVQGMIVNGFVNVSITSIEKRYNMKSRDTGFIAGSYDIACLLVSVPFSYMGSRPGASKPRWLGAGLVLMGIGSLVFASPHFLVPPYESTGQGTTAGLPTDLCNANRTLAGNCDAAAHDADLSRYRYLFIFAQFLLGFGAVPIYTIGVAFLDESVSPSMSSLYLGIFFAMAVVGPAIGYGLGGQFLQFYVDAPYVNPDTLGISPSSDRWLGAWWMGFFLAGAISVLVAIPILMTPPVIPRQKQSPDEGTKVNEDSNDSLDGVTAASAFQHIKGLKGAIMSLLKNVTFVTLSVAESSEGFCIAGLAAFMPKMLQSQFSISAGVSAMLVGAVAIPAGGGGTFLGGWIIKRFRLQCEDVIKLCFAVCCVCTLSCFTLFVYCSSKEFAGVNVQYQTPSTPATLPSLVAPCNSKCGCDSVSYNPVCGSNNITYYSPCHAGCKNSTKNKEFSECSCVASSLELPPTTSASPAQLLPGQATLNTCTSDCNLLVPFLMVLLVVMFLTFFISMPNVAGTLRCVDKDHRALALGLQGLAFRVIGTIPAPILFGVAIDRSCALWEETCGTHGACVVYDNYYMSRYIMALVFAAKIVSVISFFLAWRSYTPPAPPIEGAPTPKDAAEAPPSTTDSSYGAVLQGTSSDDTLSKQVAYDNLALDAT